MFLFSVSSALSRLHGGRSAYWNVDMHITPCLGDLKVHVRHSIAHFTVVRLNVTDSASRRSGMKITRCNYDIMFIRKEVKSGRSYFKLNSGLLWWSCRDRELLRQYEAG